MALFQHSVLNKYLQELDKLQIETAYNKFISNFGNPEKQNNIRAAKEEQYQEGFLRELFVEVLGYTINPQPNYNLTTEYKNEKDAKKADGAILKESKPIAIIELKGTDTIDLGTVEIQAFNYKNNQSNCKYIITSNFEKLRFYIDNSTGMRVSEVIDLKIENIDSKRMLIHIIQAKGRKDRDVPLSPTILELLRDYFKEYRPKEYLFNGQFDLKYSSESCNQIVKKYLGKDYHFHLLRHSCFTHLLESGTDCRIIQKIAGHSNIKTTEGYTHVSTNLLKNIKLPI